MQGAVCILAEWVRLLLALEPVSHQFREFAAIADGIGVVAEVARQLHQPLLDQGELSPRQLSGARAFGAAKGFEFGFERGPISAVLGLFGADLGIEGFAQGVAGARKGELKQGVAAG